MDPGNWIRFRVEQIQFVDVGPIRETVDDETQMIPNRNAAFTIYVIFY
jgi:hypothetical protein